MSHKRAFHYGLCASLLALVQTATATSGDMFTLQLAAGYAWDNNVGLDELERATGESDEVTLLEALGSVQFDLPLDSTLRLSASISDESYKTFSLVDRRTESVGVNFETRLGNLTAGVNWFDVSADLDHEKFLQYERLSPYLSGFLSKRWFVRGEYIYGEKQIENRPGREADSHSGSLDNYYFIQGLKRYVVMGYTYRVDNARANRYDYESHALKLRYLHRGTVGSLPLEFEAESRWEERRYKEPDPFIREKREDTRIRLSVQLTASVTSYASIALQIKNSNYDSNLPTASYSDLVVGTELRLTF